MPVKKKVEHANRMARAALPFGPQTDMLLEQMEGGKRRLSNGEVSFQDSPKNLALVRRFYPDLKIELPQSLAIDPHRVDISRGAFSSRTDPSRYRHQNEAFRRALPRPYYALFMEQGTGKTRVAIDLAGQRFADGEITGVFIVTFKGIHEQWVTQQLPQHIGLLAGRPIDYEAHAFNGKPVLWQHGWLKRLCFLTANFEAMITPAGKVEIERFFEMHRGSIMMIVDESHGIKTFNSLRTEACIELGRKARYKLIMSGTPITKSLEDEFSQLKFLNEDIFGVRYVSGFRTMFFDRFGNPKNVEKFRKITTPHCFRVTKDECLDLPPKIKERYVFDLASETRRLYNELKRNFLTQLATGESVTVQNAAVLLIRLQQLTGGVLVDEDRTRHFIGTERIDALTALLRRFEEEKKIIIWARFTADIDEIYRTLLHRQYGVVKLYGASTKAEREQASALFMRDPHVKFLVANPAVGGTGYNFQGACRTVIYYSNSFDSVQRWQSEDRTHRIGTTHSVLYVDLVARNTVDNKLLDNLQSKKDLADLILDTADSEGLLAGTKALARSNEDELLRQLDELTT